MSMMWVCGLFVLLHVILLGYCYVLSRTVSVWSSYLIVRKFSTLKPTRLMWFLAAMSILVHMFLLLAIGVSFGLHMGLFDGW